MQVFHGSYTAIDEVDFNKCQSNKDFGKGFYVTKFRSQAEDWAKIIGKANKTKGIVTEFTFYENRAFAEEDGLKALRFSNYSEEWFDFVILNRDRTSTEQKHDYDIIEGPVADDKIQSRIQRFIDGKITKEEFFNDLIYHFSRDAHCATEIVGLHRVLLNRHIDTILFRLLVCISKAARQSNCFFASLGETRPIWNRKK